MIRLFNTNQPTVFIWLILLSILVHLPYLWVEYPFLPNGIIGSTLMSYMMPSGHQNLWLVLLDILLLFVNSVVLNYILAEKELIPRRTYLPALFFTLYCGFILPTNLVYAQLTCLLVILSIGFLLHFNPAAKSIALLFWAGLSLGTAFLLNWTSAYLLFLGFYLLVQSNANSIRFHLLLLFSFLTPLYFYWIGLFLFNHGIEVSKLFYSLRASSFIHFVDRISAIQWISFLLVGLLFFLGVNALSNSDNWKTQKFRRYYTYLFLVMALAMLVYLLNNADKTLLVFTAIGFSAMVPHIFLWSKINVKKQLLVYLAFGSLIASLSIFVLQSIG